MTRSRARACALFLLSMAASWIVACASFDRAGVLRNVQLYEHATTITEEECTAMDSTADALRGGPNKALHLIGKAGELNDAASIMRHHAVQCREAMSRPLSPDRQVLIRDSFSESWTLLREIVQ